MEYIWIWLWFCGAWMTVELIEEEEKLTKAQQHIPNPVKWLIILQILFVVFWPIVMTFNIIGWFYKFFTEESN